MNKHNYLMALAMNSGIATLHLSDTAIPVKITEVESENSASSSPMTTFKCLVVNDDQIRRIAKTCMNSAYGVPKSDFVQYSAADVYNTMRARDVIREATRFEITKVIFNNPATIVIWADGSKTVVKCQEGDVYSKETGLALCFAKRALGNKGNFNDVFHKWIPEEEGVELDAGDIVIPALNLGATTAEAARSLSDGLAKIVRGFCRPEHTSEEKVTEDAQD